jgi:hypothetical protein
MRAHSGSLLASFLALSACGGSASPFGVDVTAAEEQGLVVTKRLGFANADIVPFDDRLAFNRIGSLDAPPSNRVFDRNAIVVTNRGNTALTLLEPTIVGPFALEGVEYPYLLAPGAQVSVGVVFVATSGNLHYGAMDIATDDDTQPVKHIELAGFWQRLSEHGQEPSLGELLELFGYGVDLGAPLNHQGHVEAIGDEVLAPYWRRVDETQDVVVRQLTSFHTYPASATIRWFDKGSTTLHTLFTHDPVDGQSILPRKRGGGAARGTLAPEGAFGLKVDSEWSDPTLNDQTADQGNGCVGACGHHMRAWPAKDRDGVVIANKFIVAMDYSGVNYDYNDNVYLISNLRPDDGATGDRRIAE